MRLDLTILLAVLGACFLSMAFFALGTRHRGPDPLESKARGTFILGDFVRIWFYWVIDPLVKVAVAGRLSPTFFNLLGAGFGALAGVAFAFHQPVMGGWAIFLGGAADVFDGRIARSTGVASPKGAFLDSTLDRFAEVGVFAGLAVFFRAQTIPSLMVALALGGSLLVSYARARGESQGVVCKVGVMQRAERLLLLGFAGLLDPVFSDWTGRPPGTLLAAILLIIAAGTLATAAYRTVWIARRLPDSDTDI